MGYVCRSASDPRADQREFNLPSTGMGLVVGIDDRGGDTATITDLVAVTPGPVADGADLLTVDAGRCAAATRAHPASGSAADFASVTDITSYRVAQGGRVVGIQVDLVRLTVNGERNRFFGGAALEIIFEYDVNAFGHWDSALSKGELAVTTT